MQGCPNQAQANHFLPQDLSQDLSQGISQGFCQSGHPLDSIARACEHAAREYLARRGPGVYMSLLHVGAVQAICESVQTSAPVLPYTVEKSCGNMRSGGVRARPLQRCGWPPSATFLQAKSTA